MAQPERGMGSNNPDVAQRLPGENGAKTAKQKYVDRDGKGPSWAEITKWQTGEKLGRVIGAADFFSLPLIIGTPDWRNERVLLIFPETGDMCTVGPMQSAALVDRERESENEGYRSDFRSIFFPGQTPFRHPSWEPKAGITTFESFLENADAFSVVVDIPFFTPEERETVINAALDKARELQERDRIDTMLKRKDGVIDLFDPDGLVFLSELSTEFSDGLIDNGRRGIKDSTTTKLLEDLEKDFDKPQE